ncbi:MAG: riboflavin synthase [Verrucomicrobiota bacterium]|nr:riboflavin synthase [Verrucomicrobiota bacterium]
MFTGIVTETGQVQEIQSGDAAIRLEVQAATATEQMHVGDSIAVNGCCLTAVEFSDGISGHGRTIHLDLLQETWKVTNLHQVRSGSKVNLERPLCFNGSLDGHFVTGHIDGCGRVTQWEKQGSDWLLEVEPPEQLMPYLIHKGSVALDGISLTVARVLETRFQVWIIPHTYQVTNLHTRRVGDLINIETDLLGKYVARFAKAQFPSPS